MIRIPRLWAIARKEALQIRRDPRSLGMAFVIPMVLLFLFGYALTLDVNNLKTIVYDQDGSSRSRDFLARFQESRYFTVVAVAERLADMDAALDSGRAQVGLVLPRNFARDLDLGRTVPVQALLDGADSNTATIAMSYLEAIGSRYSAGLRMERSGLGPRDPAIEARVRVWYNPELLSKNFIIPGLIAVIMMVIAALLTSLTIAREWERGTMEQLIATPLRVPELILGKLLPYFGIGVLDVVLAVLGGVLVFGVPLRGSVVLLLALSMVFLLGALSLGMLISIKTKSQLLASQVAMVVTFLPSFLLSGFMYDIGNMPVWLQAITHLFPARYFVTILKAIFLKGVGLRLLWPEALFLTLFAVLVTVAANRKFRKSLD
jgi:ABC-2 type transport system permease protein